MGDSLAEQAKSAGNVLFKGKKFEAARREYTRGIVALADGGDDMSDREILALAVALRINRAAASLNIGKAAKKGETKDLEACVEDCTYFCDNAYCGYVDDYS